MFESPSPDPERNNLVTLTEKQWKALNQKVWNSSEVLDFEGNVTMSGVTDYWSTIDFRPAWPTKEKQWCPFGTFALVTCNDLNQRAYHIDDVVAYELQINFSSGTYWKDHLYIATPERALASEIAYAAYNAALVNIDPMHILHEVSIAAVCRGIEVTSHFQVWPYK